ncbi:MAG: hypothetical protein BRC30_01080 [Nanohaloarchaea archaeon SW_7_46_7]|nr:MAG: hypothetical protein BRC30_01080 [Nanohaloarchaea archaeon SW_7_46_7]
MLNLLERVFISLKVPSWDIYFWQRFFWDPYSLFTAPMTVFLFLYLLKKPDLGNDSRINLYGKYTLIGYILHPIIIGGFVGLSLVLEALLPPPDYRHAGLGPGSFPLCLCPDYGDSSKKPGQV